MAPDLVAQIIENCRFCKPGHFCVVTARDPESWRAFAIRSHAREPFLSGTGPTSQAALDDLHAKSAEATQTCISEHGFGWDDDSDSGSTLSVSACELSDDETVSVVRGCHGKGKRHAQGEACDRGRSRSRSRSRPRSRSGSPPSYATNANTLSPQLRFGPNQMPIRSGNPIPPPPPPGWTNPPLQSTRPPAAHPFVTRPAMSAGPMPPAPLARAVPPGLDLRLHLRWAGRGEKRTIERAAGPSAWAIQAAALECVRRSPLTFPGTTTTDAMPSQLGALRATLRRATIDGEDYDLAGCAGGDLRRVVEYASRSSVLPRFEVEIDSQRAY